MMLIIDNILDKIRNSNLPIEIKCEVILIVNNAVKEGRIKPLESEGVILHPDCCKVVQGDKVDYLPKKAFMMLYYLMSNVNVIKTRDDIIKNCWERGVIVGHRTIDVHAYKIKTILKNKTSFKTQKRIGYGWIINHT
jgi:DNA-binding response OmpR family regulator